MTDVSGSVLRQSSYIQSAMLHLSHYIIVFLSSTLARAHLGGHDEHDKNLKRIDVKDEFFPSLSCSTDTKSWFTCSKNNQILTAALVEQRFRNADVVTKSSMAADVRNNGLARSFPRWLARLLAHHVCSGKDVAHRILMTQIPPPPTISSTFSACILPS